MSDKPSPSAMPSRFMGAAVAVLVGAIALYLAIQLLKHIAVPLVALGLTVFAVTAFTTWRRRTEGPSDDW